MRRVLLPLIFLVVAGAVPALADKAPTTPYSSDPPSFCETVPGNIVLNCGFETGNFTDWTVVDVTAYTAVSSGFSCCLPSNGGPDFYLPHTGNYFASLGAAGPDGTVTQNLPTVPGGTYQVGFYLALDNYPPNDFSAHFGSTTLMSFNNSGSQPCCGFPYTLFTFDVTATSTSTPLEFSSTSLTGWFSLDDVFVIATPEPASVLLLSTLAAVCAAILFKRRQSFGG